VTGGLVVTVAQAGNKLGLRAGDVITSVGRDVGESLREAAYLRPVCGGTFPSREGRRHAGAASFFATVPAGAKLAVRAPEGTMRVVLVPDTADARLTDCTDVFGRSRQIYAEADVRPDGVAVIRLPSFWPWDKQAPTTEPEFTAFVDAYRAEVVKVFTSVKTAKAIVWDARGNTGGITPVGLAIVSGFPTARPTAISYCRTRTPGSSPPAWDADRYAEYAVTPGGPFAYSGKVAVLTDGLAYSAGDYFPLAVGKASSATLVGTASAGAYGGGRAPIALAGPPALEANYDPTACFDAVTNKPLEGNPPKPTIAAAYDPADLARGKDTVLERAVKSFGF
jgi:C-terminal processing protease CtpA/Prc